MTPPAHEYDLFGDELTRAAGALDRLLDEAELVYAPTPSAASGPAAVPPGRPTITRWLRPDRLVLDPLWYVATAAAHAVIGTLLLGSVTLATALLAGIGWLAVDRLLGIPFLAGCAACVGLLAAGGTVASVLRSFRRSLSQCPW